MENKIIFLVCFMFLFSFASVFAETYNENESVAILECMNKVGSVIIGFEEAGFNVLRLDDLRLMIKESYDSGVDFDSVMLKCDSVDEIDSLAFDSRDFIDALKLFYEETDKSNVNMSSADIMIAQIDLEFENERYEKIEELVDVAYEEIIDIQSTSSALKVFYSSTRGRVVSFLEDHGKGLLVVMGIFLILYFLFRRNIKIWILHRKIRDRGLRKEVIKDLIRKTQREYFGHGKISEGMYSVRTKKFSEIMRDLDREVLSFNEGLLKLKAKK